MRILKIILFSIVVVVVAALGFGYLAPEPAVALALDFQRSNSGLTRKTIALPNGYRFVYLEGGAGEPLVLVHGFGANKDHFVPAAGHLAARHRIIIPDLIGAGESSHPPEADYSPPGQAENLHALLQALGVREFHLGGNSMGGHIALSYAAKYPEEVKSLWLLNPGGLWNGPKSEVRIQIETTGNNPLLVKSTDDFLNVMAVAMVNPPWLPRPMFEVLARERIDNQGLEEKIFKQITSDLVGDRVSGLKTPTLIVWGDRDRIIHVGTADLLHTLLPNSRVIIMPGIGHLPMLEATRKSTADYLNFLKTL